MMTREIKKGVKRQVLALRKKYCEGICSDFYMQTGIPKVEAERVEESKNGISHLMKENEKATKQAIKETMKRKRRGRKLKEEDKLIFI